MPDYKFRDPQTGKTINIRGDSPPTEQELEALFAAAPAPVASHATGPDWIDTAAAGLPAAGGLAGGLAGEGLMSIPLAALGGMVGRGAQNLISSYRHGATADVPRTVSGAALDTVGAGAEQAGNEVFGQGAGKLLRMGGHSLLRSQLKPSLAEGMIGKADDTVRTATRENLNPFAPKALPETTYRANRAGERMERIVDAQGNRPMAASHEIADAVTRTPAKYAGAGAAPEDRAAVQGVIDNFLKDVPPTGAPNMTGRELLDARRSTRASIGSNAFGVTRGAETEARKELWGQQGDTLRNAYRTTEVPQLLKEQSELIDLEKAIRSAQGRNANATPISYRSLVPIGMGQAVGGIPGAIVGGAMTSPRVLSRMALVASHVGARPKLIAQVPRALGAGYRVSTATGQANVP